MDNLYIINSENSWLNYKLYMKEPPKSSISERGNNILHFNSRNRPYISNPSAVEFVNNVLKPQGAKELYSDSAVLKFSVEIAKQLNEYSDGIFLEFGFCTGRSINFIAALAYDKLVYGFDSCEGLPVDWRPGFNKGTFAMANKNQIPFCPLDNTTLIIGLIENTLPEFVKEITKYDDNENQVKVDFIHIDTDVYKSATEIYQYIGHLIKPGKTVIVLDEGYNYWETEDMHGSGGWRAHEYRATIEFAERNSYEIKFLAYNETHQQLSLIFTEMAI